LFDGARVLSSNLEYEKADVSSESTEMERFWETD